MIKILSFVLLSVFILQAARAEFIDPMKPPEYALKKYRLEKIKKNPVVTTAGSTKKATKQDWVLNSILYSKQRQHAIVNNTLVKKGDRIDGARILQVSSDEVKLAYKGKIIKLRVNDLKARGLTTDSGFKLIKKSLEESKI